MKPFDFHETIDSRFKPGQRKPNPTQGDAYGNEGTRVWGPGKQKEGDWKTAGKKRRAGTEGK